MQMLKEIKVRLRRRHPTVVKVEDRYADAERDQGKVGEESLHNRVGRGGQRC